MTTFEDIFFLPRFVAVHTTQIAEGKLKKREVDTVSSAPVPFKPSQRRTLTAGKCVIMKHHEG